MISGRTPSRAHSARHGAARPAPHGAFLHAWGRFVARRAPFIVAFWLLFIVGGLGIAGGAFGNESLFSRLTSGEIKADGENQTGRDLLEKAGASGFQTYSLMVQGVDLHAASVAQAAQQAGKDISALEHIASVANPFVVPAGPSSPAAAPFLGSTGLDSGSFAMVVTYDKDITKEQEIAAQAKVDALFDTLVADTGADSSQRGGIRNLVDRIVQQVQDDLRTGEFIALGVSFVLLLIVFGGFLAAGMPVLGAIASIAGALASLTGFSHVLDLDASTVNVVTVLGLGLCIDYGLLMVSRYREELRKVLDGAPVSELTRDQRALALGDTLDRAGRTVIFSAFIVAISLSGLAFFEIEFIRAVSAAAVSVVIVALAVALSLVPALCYLGARRLVGRRTESGGDEGVFARLARAVHRAPWLVAAVIAMALIALAVPAFGLKTTSSGPELLPAGTPERVFFEDFGERFPLLGGSDLTIVTEAAPSQVEGWVATAKAIPGVEGVGPVTPRDAGVVTLGLFTAGGGLDDDARAVTQYLRDNPPPFTAYTVGQASGLLDFQDQVAKRAPWAVGMVVLATFILLFLMTGSVIIPLKALVMNVLSLGATLGVVVWIFEEGHLENVLRFQSTGALENTIPLLVLAFGFGLSMDYEVFLLSRIVELHEQGHDTDSAVTLGLQRSGRIITSAGLLMVVVFAGFAVGDMLTLKQMGVALVLAIILDATIVRMLLVPATMFALGRANWWAPTFLKRLHERFGITE